MEGGNFESDEVYMREALKEAKCAMEINEVPVGCVLVSSTGAVVSRGHNLTNRTCDATQHAELVAKAKLKELERVHSLFVTIEPCIMCASALRTWGLERVVFGSANDRFGGCGTVANILQRPATKGCCGEVLENPPKEVKSGVLADEAINILKEFYAKENTEFAPEEKRKKKAKNPN